MVTKKYLNLHLLDKKGFIIGPKEEEESYFKRVEKLNYFFSFPPETVDHFLTDRDWEAPLQKLSELYGIFPDWIVAHYCDQQLTFFQGAATWITQKEGVRIPLIQLRKKFESGKLYRLYRRDEVLAHEAVHAGRMQFDEPIFEEIFAYRTSQSFWRRFFGPIFQSTWEPVLLIIFLCVPLGIEVAGVIGLDIPFLVEILHFLPFVFLLGLTLRLSVFHLTLARAIKKLTPWLKKPEDKWSVALRLTDNEIFQFSYRKIAKNLSYIDDQSSLRWKVLKEKYFK